MMVIEQLRDFVANHFPLIKNLYNNFFGPKRYQYLFQFIRENNCRKIMEIGTWDGFRAKKMTIEAQKTSKDKVEYYGFDLFEDFNSSLHSENVIGKKAPSLTRVKKRLDQTGCGITLFKGDSVDILPQVLDQLPEMDLIFIDGGHTIEIIQKDWLNIQPLIGKKTIVIFDDYWNRDDIGCKAVVESIDINKYQVNILPIQDSFKKDWGILKINFVKVTRK